MNTAADRIAIEFISVLGMPPVAFVDVAADLGCRHIGIALEPIVLDSTAYARWSLRDDTSLRQDFIAALRRRNVSVSLGEGFMLGPHVDIGKTRADLDLMCELGVSRVNAISIDSDRGAAFDRCATFAELTALRGLQTTIEFLPGTAIGDLDTAVAAVRHVGNANFRVLVDAMHLFRSGATVADFAALDPDYLGYVQLCDVTLISKHRSYADEARFDRLPPGQGELPLREFVAAIPDDVIVGLELPMLAAAQAGISAHDRLETSVATTLSYLKQLPS